MTATAQTRANAVSPETAIVIPDYPYGFRLRCMMRVWVEYKPGKGFRYCSQTTNPKKEGEVWNKPKASTYSRISMAIAVDENGHYQPASLSEYSSIEEYRAFRAAHGEALSTHAAGSFMFYSSIKEAYEAKRIELGVESAYDANAEQRLALRQSYLNILASHVKAGTAY